MLSREVNSPCRWARRLHLCNHLISAWADRIGVGQQNWGDSDGGSGWTNPWACLLRYELMLNKSQQYCGDTVSFTTSMADTNTLWPNFFFIITFGPVPYQAHKRPVKINKWGINKHWVAQMTDLEKKWTLGNSWGQSERDSGSKTFQEALWTHLGVSFSSRILLLRTL